MEGRERISDGRTPLRKLDLRLRDVSASSLPRVLAGIGPLNPAPGSRSEMTRVPSDEHVTPIQEVQTDELAFQLSFLPWGTAAVKSRRACLSELRSAMSIGRSMNKNRSSMVNEQCCLMFRWFGYAVTKVINLLVFLQPLTFWSFQKQPPRRIR